MRGRIRYAARSIMSWGSNVENLTLLENLVFFLPGPLLGTGNELDNVLIGNSEDNVLSGGIGNDTLWGGSGIYRDSETIRSGNDIMIGGAGNDTYLFKLGDGIDTIQDVAAPGEGNRIQFGDGIAQTDLTFTHDQVGADAHDSGGQQRERTNSSSRTSIRPAQMARWSSRQWPLRTGARPTGRFTGGPVNHAPTLATPLADQTVQEDAPFSLVCPSKTFADEDAGDVLTLSASLADGTALPAWLSFDTAHRDLQRHA